MLAGALANVPAFAQRPIGTLLGEWTGESKCVGNNRPAWRDEQVVYVVKPAEAGQNAVSIAAYKIVNGERVLMGTADHKYDEATHRLSYEFTVNATHGRWEFTVDGASMTGTLTVLPDNTVVRRARLTKSKS